MTSQPGKQTITHIADIYNTHIVAGHTVFVILN